MDDKMIKFEIVTPERTIMKEAVRQVTVPTGQGEITVLKNHLPLVAALQPGVVEILKADSSREVISVSGGFIEVLPERVVILADAAERAAEIDAALVEAARERAEEALRALRWEDKESFAALSAQIAHELAKNKAVKRWKRLSKEGGRPNTATMDGRDA